LLGAIESFTSRSLFGTLVNCDLIATVATTSPNAPIQIDIALAEVSLNIPVIY